MRTSGTNPDRRIALILGNGFDLDLGLKTSYKDFWESEYCPKDYPTPLIRHLNQRWKKGLEAVKWYDLENELLEYAVNGDKSDVVTEEEREYIKRNSDDELSTKYRFLGTDDVFNNLADKGYLVGEEAFRVGDKAIVNVKTPYREDFAQSAIWRDRQALKLIKEGLCKYLETLSYENLTEDSIAHEVLSLMGFAKDEGHAVEVFSFNYTRTAIEDYRDLDRIVNHVHGKCSSSIIVGAGDTLEIGSDYDFLMKSFDPAFNPPSLVKSLHDADLIIIFGHSLGENDRQYFKSFFKQQIDYSRAQKKNIVFFTRDSDSMIEVKRALQKLTDGDLSTLYELNKVQILKTEGTEENRQAFLSFHQWFLSYV